MFIPKAAIFDLDGTLFDSMTIWKQIDEEFLRQRGFTCTQDYTDAIKAMGWLEGAEYTIARYHLSETPEEVMNTWFAMSEEFYAHRVPMKPFAKEYLTLLSEHQVPMAVATSMEPQANIALVLGAHGITSLFKNITLSTEVSRGKGFPDIYELAASRLGVPPRECAVFEDILVAIRGAASGGFQTVGIFDPVSGNDWKDIEKEADLAVRTWQELL